MNEIPLMREHDTRMSRIGLHNELDELPPPIGSQSKNQMATLRELTRGEENSAALNTIHGRRRLRQRRQLYEQTVLEEAHKKRQAIAPKNTAFRFLLSPFIGVYPYLTGENIQHPRSVHVETLNAHRIFFILFSFLIWILFYIGASINLYLYEDAEKWIGIFYVSIFYAFSFGLTLWAVLSYCERERLSPIWQPYYQNYINLISTTHLAACIFIIWGVTDHAPIPYGTLLMTYIVCSTVNLYGCLFPVYVMIVFSDFNVRYRWIASQYLFYPSSSSSSVTRTQNPFSFNPVHIFVEPEL